MEQSKLDSMYANYYEEFENKHTVWIPDVGFANYKFEDDISIYVQEVYVKPEHRGEKLAAILTDMCLADAERYGNIITRLYTTVAIGGNTIDQSLRAITAYGFKLLKADEQMIYFYKEISDE